MKIFCDGGARGNPGPAASAFVVFDDNGAEVYRAAKFLGVATNNVAEYEALVMGLSWLSQNPSRAQIILDSELLVKQMTGVYKIKNHALRDLAAKAKSLEKTLLEGPTYIHTVRAGNALADELVNKTLDEQLT